MGSEEYQVLEFDLENGQAHVLVLQDDRPISVHIVPVYGMKYLNPPANDPPKSNPLINGGSNE